MFKLLKIGVLSTLGIAGVGGAVLGRDVCSYFSSGVRTAQSAIKDNVPLEFELGRARDMVDDIIPEMHANVRAIAQQEVEIGGLRQDIVASRGSIDQERTRLATLRQKLDTAEVSFRVGGADYSREQVKDELARRFDSLKEAEVILSGKKRLLEQREKSLTAAVQVLEKTRSQKAMLETQIATLEAQNKLVQAAAVGSNTTIDQSKLAQTQKLIGQIKNKLDVAERVLAHESRFVQPMQIDVLNEKDLVGQVDDYLSQGTAKASPKSQAPQAQVPQAQARTDEDKRDDAGMH